MNRLMQIQQQVHLTVELDELEQLQYEQQRIEFELLVEEMRQQRLKREEDERIQALKKQRLNEPKPFQTLLPDDH
jgi:hypothetical protein